MHFTGLRRITLGFFKRFTLGAILLWMENQSPNLTFADPWELKFCRSLGAQVLIDDNRRYALECVKVSMKVLLFDYDNLYPWCKSDMVASHPLVIKVKKWEEVERHLVSWLVS